MKVDSTPISSMARKDSAMGRTSTQTGLSILGGEDRRARLGEEVGDVTFK